MKLNKDQKLALAMWLGGKVTRLEMNYEVIQNFDSFCNEEIVEWRIISNFGMAGKIWNVSDRIYVTGFSPNELGKRDYKKHQEIIDRWNKEIEQVITNYANYA